MDRRTEVQIGESINGFVDSEAVAETVSLNLDIEEQHKKAFLEFYNEKIKKYKLRSERYRVNTGMRITFSVVYTILLIWWLNKVIQILTHNNLCSFKLSDNVLIALLVTSTANVIGMVVIVLKNLFPEKNKKEKTAEK